MIPKTQTQHPELISNLTLRRAVFNLEKQEQQKQQTLLDQIVND